MYNWYTKIGENGIILKENDGGGELNYDIFYYKNFCRCHSAPQYNSNKKDFIKNKLEKTDKSRKWKKNQSTRQWRENSNKYGRY
jgi:hypothetical protein